ncbi:PIN domain-containing protein [Persicitalea sp.]|uniref:PIN domain-containing protein n=1 Tax=Persicitalea sp. TaxID=3100273 RepID=UPI0035938E12
MRVFLDSSLPIEYLKGSRKDKDLLKHLLKLDIELVIDHTVFSEFMFNFLTIRGKKSGLAIKESKLISALIGEYAPQNLLSEFRLLSPASDLQDEVIRLMNQYNLLPNDALILAHCLDEPFEFVASYDSDFVIPCQKEGITLIDSIESFQRLFLIG